MSVSWPHLQHVGCLFAFTCGYGNRRMAVVNAATSHHSLQRLAISDWLPLNGSIDRKSDRVVPRIGREAVRTLRE
ncbi:MAG: hypothetical protein ACETV0_08680 [Nitrososphaeria archaeon]